MIVCVCHSVSDSSIRTAAAMGASHEDIVRSTGAGSSCGCCADSVASIVEKEGGCRGSPCPGCPRKPTGH